jgi:hypothetical protein
MTPNTHIMKTIVSDINAHNSCLNRENTTYENVAGIKNNRRVAIFVYPILVSNSGK